MSLDSAYELGQHGRVFTIAERDSGDVVAAFYPPTGGPPGWWWGHAFGRPVFLHLPGLDPEQVAVEFMKRR